MMFCLARDLGDENPVSLRTLTDHAFSNLQGGAGPAKEGDRPTQVRGRGADNRYAAQRVIQGRAGIVWVAVRPGG